MITFFAAERFLEVNRVIIWITGSPSSSCEMIIFRNNSHSGIIRVCMGIFTTALRNKKYVKLSKKISHLTSTAYCLLSDRSLWWKERILASCPFRGFQRTSEKRKAEHSISERPIWEAKNSSAKWPGGHKSNAESKHIYCSFISIHYKLNLPRATDAKPQFASKISSLEVSNSPRPHQPWHTTVENQLGNLASFFKLSLAGDPTVTWHEEIVPWC